MVLLQAMSTSVLVERMNRPENTSLMFTRTLEMDHLVSSMKSVQSLTVSRLETSIILRASTARLTDYGRNTTYVRGLSMRLSSLKAKAANSKPWKSSSSPSRLHPSSYFIFFGTSFDRHLGIFWCSSLYLQIFMRSTLCTID